MKNKKEIKNNKENTKGKKTQRIIKRNKWKIIIILSIILVIIIGISVGLYFVFKPNSYSLNTNNIKIAKIDDVRNDILDSKGNNIGLYFYKENGDTTNYLMWSNKEGMDADDNEKSKGPLSTHIDGPSSIDTTWYAVNIEEDSSQILSNLFLYKAKDGVQEAYVNYEAFDPFFNGDGFGFNEMGSNSHYIENASYSSENENDINDMHDKFDGVNIIDASTSNPKVDWNVSDGTTMWFDGITGQVMSVINNYSTPENLSDENANDFNTMIKNWWEEIEKGISKNR